MDNFKRELYQQEYGKPFPFIRQLTFQEMDNIRKTFFSEFMVSNPLDLILKISISSIHINNVNAIDENSFSINQLFMSLNKSTRTNVYINWFRFDNIDEIRFNDFAAFFYDIWFPSSDDINIFDKSCTWIVSIRHDGEIFIWNKK